MKPFSYLYDPWREDESLKEKWERALNDPVYVVVFASVFLLLGFSIGFAIGVLI